MKLPFFIYYLIFSTLFYGQEYTIRDISINTNGETPKIRNKMGIDHHGFLWYSTNNGLIKDFETHAILSSFLEKNKKNPPKIIHVIFFDSWSRVWVCTDTGVFVSNESLDKSFDKINFKQLLKGEEFSVNNFIEDCNGNVWMATVDNQILKADRSFSIEKYQIPEIAPKYIDTAYFMRNFLIFESVIDCNKILSRQGRKLFILENGKINLIADFTATINYKKQEYFNPEWEFNGGDGLLITNDGAIFPKSKETHYTYKGDVYGVNFIKDLDIQIINLPLQEMITITKDKNPILKSYADLIGIDDFGKKLCFYKMEEINKSFHLKKTHEIPFSYAIDDVVIDKNDIIYVSSYNRISKIRFRKSGFHKILYNFKKRNVSTRGFLELPNEDILIASYSGIFKLSNNNNNNGDVDVPKNVFPSLNYIRSFLKTSDSTTWCIGENKKLTKINFLEDKILEHHVFDTHWKLGNLQYYDILKHTDSTFLIASNFGLQEFNTKQKKFKELSILPVNNNQEVFVRDLHKTEDKLYISTDRNGLFIKDLKTGTFLTLKKDDGNSTLDFPTNKVYMIFLDQQENLWLATDVGAICVDKDFKKMLTIDRTFGLTNSNVVGILEDASGNMWFSTYGGLFKYDKKTNKVVSFFVEDGLTFNDFNQSSYFRSSKNKMYFGGINGIIAFDSINGGSVPEEIKIFPTKFEYYDHDKEKEVRIDVLNEAGYSFNLPYNRNSLSISYTINDCFNTENNRYLYRLDGFTDDWINLGNQTTLKLLSIPPGNYVLRVKGLNSAGLESFNELLYKVHVSKVFYKRPWVQAIVVLLFLGLFSYGILNRTLKQRKKYRLHLAMVELERKSLRTQMHPHFMFNMLNMVRRKVRDKKLSELENHISAFSSLMRLTLDITRNDNILLSKEIQYIKNYIILINAEGGNKIVFAIQCEPKININKIFIPSMILQPIIENCILHAFPIEQKDKLIILKIEKSIRTKQLILTIKDNGLGISNIENRGETNQEHQPYATQILYERLKLMNQTTKRKFGYEIITEDLKNEGKRGTRVTIKIPY
ncbi:sensor histidine kinase [Flavivirga rizhaonensis]|uniref:Signal transduction histidine kinase internal region domain-containing protein n=1 Tax=Flavivirga rizhaonensis TaxID=2559571 RepID=A0A4S1E1C2_9FLAO|nr:sensor histidine kinase [Flavivirga rizhaonensis]TGV04471.1 hypothetical protein EM932_02800 [Flavivirga rizhaonensis]